MSYKLYVCERVALRIIEHVVLIDKEIKGSDI